MKSIEIQKVKLGHLFQLKNDENAVIYVRGDFNRCDGFNRYQCEPFSRDLATKNLKTNRIVFID